MKWSRVNTVLTMLLLVLGTVAAWLVVPEFRRWIGWEKPDSPMVRPSISGIVVEEVTNRGIGQATITLGGSAGQYLTEDSGNFIINLAGDVPKRLRLRVSKDGFQPLDTSVEPPADNLVLSLRKQ